ncbi:DNA-binding protein [Pseudomonas asplenii]|uniref:Replication region DNA-binding N-term n=1 Tax=Pseudomonas asplenii TaxID=53407 RepID=A0A1H6NWE2_9PSED|nr:DNA-binding protein [Pseudomonas fuscovaginae]SEI21115.1 replication region DNA-binding N-term [Pseudomonas fuscovaginae]
MARGGVNKAVVQTARLAILARGEYPSIDAVRIEMGNTGSKTTIHRYLKELDESDQRQAAAGENLDDELTDLITRLARRLQEQAREPLELEQARHRQQESEWKEQLGSLSRQLQKLQHDFEVQATALAQETEQLHTTRSMLQTEQTRNAGLTQACSDHELRLADKEAQVRSLEDKHQHARDALEHFRNAAREQREQEQRRHEGQLQQVQMELRQAQQSALVRQDEITQLHRDNERLLAESRGLAKEARQLEEQLHKSSKREEQLQDRASALESERTLLQERLRVALQENQELSQSAEQQQAANKTLELKVLEIEAMLVKAAEKQAETPAAQSADKA